MYHQLAAHYHNTLPKKDKGLYERYIHGFCRIYLATCVIVLVSVLWMIFSDNDIFNRHIVSADSQSSYKRQWLMTPAQDSTRFILLH